MTIEILYKRFYTLYSRIYAVDAISKRTGPILTRPLLVRKVLKLIHNNNNTSNTELFSFLQRIYYTKMFIYQSKKFF